VDLKRLRRCQTFIRPP